MKQDKFYKAWEYLENHPYFQVKIKGKIGNWQYSCFNQSLDIEVVLVCPITKHIEDNPKNNTLTQVWLESGAWDYEHAQCTHDYKLDCGGDTFEEAIIKLSKLVKKHYGKKKNKAKRPHSKRR